MRWLWVAVLVLGCRTEPEPVQWLGMERSTVSCGYESTLRDNLTCIGTGHVYKCVTDDWRTWRCAEVRRVEAER